MIDLPTNFKGDIQGSNTSLVPWVIIGNHENWTDGLLISTGAFKLDGLPGLPPTLPLLLNVPSLKESIDLEKRNYKISSVNIDLSNYEYNGKRLSELISEKWGSLINVECRIFWVSPNTTMITLRDIATGNTWDPAGDALEIYVGTVRRYDHDDTKVRLVVEDKSQATLHRDLPLPNTDTQINWLGTGDDVPDKYKLKPIPMVYGRVDKSPCVIKSNGTKLITVESEIISFDKDSSIWGDDSSLYIFTNDSYVNIYDDHVDPQSKGILIKDTTLSFANQVPCRVRYTPLNIFVGNGEYNSIILEDEVPLLVDNNLGTFVNKQTSGEIGISPNIDNHMFILIWSHSKDIDIEDKEIGGNSYGFITHAVESDDETGETWMEPVDFPLVRKFYSAVNEIILPSSNNPNPPADHYYFIIQPNTLTFFDEMNTSFTITGDDNVARDLSSLLGLGFDAVANESSDITAQCEINNNNESVTRFIIDSGLQGWQNAHAIEAVGHGQAGLDYLAKLKLKDFSIMSEFVIGKMLDKDFYANVQGREMSGSSSPTAPVVIASIMNKELDYTTADNHLIDTAGVDAYNSWEYAFTVDKKINSKKLLEGIASASPYIPRFNNMGKFKFDIIKPKYSQSDPSIDDSVNGWIEIKADDVISSSFSRTKIEDVYTKVEFKYHWDYAGNKFIKSTTVGIEDFGQSAYTPYSRDYYGVTESESTLVIDDDRGKYIRDSTNSTTAYNFALWVLRFYANQHLKMKIRMPLRWMYIEIGDILRFDKIIDVKPYGINYAKDAGFLETTTYPYYGDIVNGQQVYPDFMVTSTNKTMEFCEIECIQMHNLTESLNHTLIPGCMNEIAWNYNPAAEIDDGSCLIGPSNNGVGANANFDNAFLQQGADACYRLIHQDNESYMSNYPEPGNPMFDENLPYGNDIVPTTNNYPAGPRYLYTKNEHITSASEWYKAGYDPLTNTSTNMPKLYRESECFPQDIIEQSLLYMDFVGFYDLTFGLEGENYSTGFSPQPVSTRLQSQARIVNNQMVGWGPNYNQQIADPYPFYDSGGWDFHYVPLPMWSEAGQYNSAINNKMASHWVSQGSPLTHLAHIAIRITNIRLVNVGYNDDGSVQYNDNTYPMKSMTISIVPPLHRYRPAVGSPFNYPSEYEIDEGVQGGDLVFTEIPNLFTDYGLEIKNQSLVRHYPPSSTDTLTAHSMDIFTIHLRVVIENEFTVESDVTIRLRFGATGWGGPKSIGSFGWGE